MKKIILLIILLVPLIQISANEDTKWVLAEKGLFVREKPNTKSKIISRLIFGENIYM
jgi:uncharacterized protein YgiM (DUF1202 family)